MAKENLEARRTVHSVLEKAHRAEKLSLLESFAAEVQVDGLFLDRTGDPIWVDFALDSIEYGDAQCDRSVDTLSEIEIENPTGVQVEETLTRKESVAEQTTFSFTEGIKVGVSEKETVKVSPAKLLDMGVELTYSVNFDFQTQQTVSCQRSREFDVNTKVAMPPHTSVKATIEIDKVRFKGPFKAYYVPVFTDEGRKEWIRRLESIGECKGVSVKPLEQKSFRDLFPSLRDQLRIACEGRLNGAAGVDIKVVLSEPKNLAAVP